jgi:excisionase family DNA binding protein
MTTLENQPLWSCSDVAAYLNVPKSTLYQWAHRNVGPPRMIIGRHARYRPEDVLAWAESQVGR